MEYNNNGLSIDDMFTKSSYAIRKILPFYGITYFCMGREENSKVETIGVTESTLLYNKDFVINLSIPELNFINVHEIAHVALRHVSRGKNKDPKLWNIACDLFTNSFIEMEINNVAEELYIKYRLNGPDTSIKLYHSIEFKMPLNSLYCSSIDLETETVEKIYDNLYKQGNVNGYNSMKNQLDRVGETFHFEYIGSKGLSTNIHSKFEIDIDKSQYNSDLVDNGHSKEVSEQLSDMMANRIKTKEQLDKSSCMGLSNSKLELELDKLLKSEINWKRFIQKYCIRMISTDSSFKYPDKRMYYQRAIYPGQSIDESNTVKGIKICIDTSGSISDNDFNYFIGQIKSLLDKYKVDAEIVYWDDTVNCTGNFTNFRELRNTIPKGRGCTNVSVVFDYLSSKKCKVKPILTVIFTDGYFDNNFETSFNKRNFKDTLWVMTKDHNKLFKPCFGTVIVPKFN